LKNILKSIVCLNPANLRPLYPCACTYLLFQLGEIYIETPNSFAINFWPKAGKRLLLPLVWLP